MTTNNLDALIDREITVLMGGWCAEREISLKTGKAVTNSIKSLGLKVRAIDLLSPDQIKTGNAKPLNYPQARFP